MDHAVLFGRRLRSLREMRGLKQKNLAEKAQLATKYISQLETGAAQPSFDAIVSFSRVLDVPMYAFFLFDRDEKDERILKRRIENVIDRSTLGQLQQTYRLIMDVIEPTQKRKP